jgi:hypothetical protein
MKYILAVKLLYSLEDLCKYFRNLAFGESFVNYLLIENAVLHRKDLYDRIPRASDQMDSVHSI